jgi:hypothetical protein
VIIKAPAVNTKAAAAGSAGRSRDRLLGAALLLRIACGAACLGIACLAPAGSALAQEQKAGGNTVRPEIGKPIQAALDLLKSKRGKDALAKVHETDAVANKTPYESYLVERVRAQASAAAGDAPAAARAFELTAAAPAATAAEKLQFLAASSGQYYLAQNYGKSAELAARYIKDGGTEKAMRTLYAQALYLNNDFAAASKELLGQVLAEEQAGKAPAEEPLQLLANIYAKQRDNAGYANIMEKLVAYHPKKDYWVTVVQSVGARPGFSERLALDFARLKLVTGTMRSAAEFVEAAQLSIQAGLPAEAKKIIDQGYAAGLLGTGADADRHRRLKDMASKNLAEDAKTLGQDDAQLASGKDGTALLNMGLNYVLLGSGEKGLEMMEQGLRKGGLKYPDDARLHLGYAYHVAGRNQKAIDTFKKVQGAEGPASLARLWVIHLARGS